MEIESKYIRPRDRSGASDTSAKTLKGPWERDRRIPGPPFPARQPNPLPTASAARNVRLAGTDLSRALKPGETLFSPGMTAGSVCRVLHGLLLRQTHTSPVGRRCVTGLYFPGDLFAFNALSGLRFHDAISSVGSSEVESLTGLAGTEAVDAAVFWKAQAVDQVRLTQWLTRMGWRDAYFALSHLLCEFAIRATAGRSVEGFVDVPFPLRQTDLAAAIGITPVHVNRTLQVLRREGMVDVTRNRLVISDVRAFCEKVQFIPL
jgi:CRP-like cAMP-binding protein